MNQPEAADPVPVSNSPDPTPERPLYDVLVVGAGIAGLSLAAAAARQGRSVLLVAARDTHPREFRAEKFSASEMAILDGCGLGVGARAVSTPLHTVIEGRWGRLIKRMASQEFAFHYPELVDAARAALPTAVTSVTGRISAAETGAETQTLTLADGRRYTGRLLVVATGLGEGLQRELGFERRLVSQGNTLVYGFNTAFSYALLAGEQLIWSAEAGGDGVAYLTLFPLGTQIRANLFTYWPRGGTAAEAFLADPAGTMRRLMPGLARTYGTVEPVGAIQQRPIDLVEITDPVRDGVVVIGDAFCTTCPAYGTGIRKALSDVTVLASLLPAWFATPGMDAAKIGSYYAHPEKLAADQRSVGVSLRLRRMAMGRDLVSRFLNLRSTVYRRGQQAVVDAAAKLRRGTHGASATNP
ncbi:FAD-dependent oxidoreductase [Methylobacterium symbioticum]|uniref:Kynurenine 3-monooxygenase n=1 Tax=Methylobacterium symbioticum TaxID=2584084 RepID=A0A509EDQ9_9HYPH|nr:FAD-dependent oxidoreductase [Methylobacterium symbioticum]VUD71714.1 Kynurenine 3-monooxygenase [Methylobacterium symbioticum]